MTGDLEALYRAAILEHRSRPRNFRALDTGRKAEGSNPLCGDRLTVYVRIESGTIEEATFQGFGCAIAMASASLMTGSVRGRTVTEALALSDRFQQMITAPAGDAPAGVAPDDLGDLVVLAGVREFPVRVKCATLPWQAFRAAAGGGADVVSTE